MSRKKPRKSTRHGIPIVLPRSFAGGAGAQDAAAQQRQIQDMIDLLKRNQLTELEIERAALSWLHMLKFDDVIRLAIN